MQVFGRAPKKKNQALEVTRVRVANVSGGVLVNMNDDGLTFGGQPAQQRGNLLRKLKMRDDDGDPIFAFPGKVPDLCLRWDNEGALDPVFAAARSLDDRSQSPLFETLREKFEANQRLRDCRSLANRARTRPLNRQESARLKELGLKTSDLEQYAEESYLPPAIEAMSEAMAAIEAKQADKAAAGAVKGRR